MDLKLGRLETEVSRTLTKFGTQLEAQLKRAETRIISFSAIAGTLYTVQTGFTNLIKSTMEVEKALTDVNVIANTSSKELKKFGNELFNIAKDTNQAFSTVTTAAIELSRQGLGLQETLKRTKDAMILTQLSGLSANDAIETLSATINSFNKELITSTDIVNKFAAVDAKFAVSSADLANAVKRVGASAQEAGVGLDELIGLVTAAQQTTARGGAVIGNSIKTIFTRIERPKVIDQLEEMQIKTRDLNGELLPATQILTNLSLAYDKLSQSEKSHTAELVGGIYQINLLKATLSDLEKKGNSVSAKAMDISQNSQDIAYARSVELNKTMESQVNRLMLNLKQVGAGAGAKSNLSETYVGGILKSINSALDNDTESGGESVGNKIAQSIVSGITKTLFNQGALIFSAYFLKITKELTQSLTSMSDGVANTITLANRQATQVEKTAAIQSLVTDAVAKTDNALIQEAEARKLIIAQIANAIKLEEDRKNLIVSITNELTKANSVIDFSAKRGFILTGNSAAKTKNVPNAADPIRSAIQREISSGVPASSVSVGTHPALVNSNNPHGFGVYNSIDEPKGISQGISRAYSEGRNPQNYNVPNFAFGQFSHGEPQSFGESWYKSNLVSQEARLSGLFQSASKLTSAFENLEKTLRTTSFGAKSAFENLEKTTRSLKNYTDYKQSNYLLEYKQPAGLLGQGNVFNMPEYMPESAARIQARRQYAINKAGLSAAGSKGGNFVFDAETGQMLPGKLASWQSGYDPIDITKFTHTPGSFYSAGRPTNNPTPQLLLGSGPIPLSQLDEIEKEIQNRRISNITNKPYAQINTKQPSKYNEKFQNWFSNEGLNRTFTIGMGASILSNTASSMIGNESSGSRFASGIVSTLGDTVSNGVLAGVMTKGNPLATASIAIVTLVHGVIKSFRDFTDPLPDLIKTLDDSKEKISKMEAGFTNFMRISDLLSDPEGKLSDKQRFRLTNERQAALSNFAPEDRAKLYEAIAKGNPAEASRIYSELSTGPVNKKIFDELAAFITGQKKNGVFDIKKMFLSTDEYGNPMQESRIEVNEKSKKTEDAMRSLINSITNPEGASIETLLTENPELRQKIFGRLKYGNARSALALALQATGVDNEKRESLLSQIDQSGEDFSKYFYENFFTGNLSQSALEQSGKLTRNMPKVINNEKLRKFKLANNAYLEKSGYDYFDKVSATERELVLNKLGFGTELSDLKNESDLAKLRSSQGVTQALLEPTMTSSQMPELQYSQQIELLKAEKNKNKKLIEMRYQDAIKRSELNSVSQYNESVNPILSKYYSDQSNKAQNQVSGVGEKTIQQMQENFKSVKIALEDTSSFRDYINSEISKITNQVTTDPSLLSGPNSPVEYQKVLEEILATITSIDEKRRESDQKALDDSDQAIAKLEIEMDLKEKVVELERKKAKILQENTYKLNTDQLIENIDREGKLSVQKYDFARTRYAGGYLSTDELNAARTSAMESYRGAYGINKNLENANIYESFRSQFDYNTTDRFKEMERSAVELGSTMKSSFADAFKSFSLGAKSAGNAFRDFGMSILDKITSITSNISTNLLFNSIGSLMPSSGFAKLFSAPTFSTGGLVTGGSGTRDDVPAALAPGDFVMRRAAVEKYGQGFMASLNNSYDYNDAKYPTAGNLNVDPRLSVAALEDENNPQNALRKSREENLVSYIKEKEQYDLQKKNAMSAYRSAQNQRLIGAYISAGIMSAGAGLKGSFGGAKDSFGNKIPTGGYTYSNPNAYSQPYMNTELRGFAVGGSVNGSGSADTVPALLTGGEYVLNRAAVNKIGLPTLENINALRYASGGLVGNNYSVTNNQTSENTLSALLQSINALKQSIDTSKQQPGKTNEASGITNYISVNVTSSGGEPKSDVSVNQKGKTDSGSSSSPTLDDMKKLGNLVKNVVYEVILQETKPGGLMQKQV